MRYEYRVTKYDPRLRDSSDSYIGEDWTSISQVGQSFAGHKLTMPDYLKTETNYLIVMSAMLEEAKVTQLLLRGLENARAGRQAKRDRWREGALLSLKEVTEFARLALREELWGMLIAPRRAFVHFGYDFYMYVGLSRSTPGALELATRVGIFVEPFPSPYSEASRRISAGPHQGDMAKRDLEQSWARTERFLNEAAALVPLGDSKNLAQYKDYLDHNELELAMDELFHLGKEAGYPSTFFFYLKLAAQNMGLIDRAKEIDLIFSAR